MSSKSSRSRQSEAERARRAAARKEREAKRTAAAAAVTAIAAETPTPGVADAVATPGATPAGSRQAPAKRRATLLPSSAVVAPAMEQVVLEPEDEHGYIALWMMAGVGLLLLLLVIAILKSTS
jgi:hypothetical protein